MTDLIDNGTGTLRAPRNGKMISFAKFTDNICGLLCQVMWQGGQIGVKLLTSEEYSAFRDKIYYGQDPKTHIEAFLGEEVHMAMSKPIDKMSKAELEAEYDFVTGEEKVFQTLSHAKSAVQALIDRKELMTPEAYKAWLKSLPDTKPDPAPMLAAAAANTGFLGGIKKDADAEDASEANSHEARLVAKDFRDVRGRIEGKYTKEAIAARKAGTPLPPKEKPVKQVFEKPTSGVYEYLSKEDVGAGDALGNHVKEIDNDGGIDALVKDNKLDGSKLSKDAVPNQGIRKMRIVNALRVKVKKGEDVMVAGIVYRLSEGAKDAPVKGKKR